MAEAAGSAGPLCFSGIVWMNLCWPAGIARLDSRQRVGVHFGSVLVLCAQFGKQFGKTIAWYFKEKWRKAP
jgi:hypothetical protein